MAKQQAASSGLVSGQKVRFQVEGHGYPSHGTVIFDEADGRVVVGVEEYSGVQVAGPCPVVWATRDQLVLLPDGKKDVS